MDPSIIEGTELKSVSNVLLAIMKAKYLAIYSLVDIVAVKYIKDPAKVKLLKDLMKDFS